MSRISSILAKICLFVAMATSAHLEGAKLHAIMVADVHDSSIGLSVRQDVFQWLWEFTRIEEYTDLELEQHLIVDSSFDADTILSTIRNLEVGPDDTIIFAYSGHGFRNESKESQWPVMFVGWGEDCLDVTTVAQTIAEKEARFSLVVADCCNSIYPDLEAPSYRGVDTRAPGDFTAENYRRLWQNSEGVLVISASAVGEYAYGYSTGGIFTYNFLGNMRRDSRALIATSWETILAKASGAVIHKQTPIYTFYQKGESISGLN